MDAQPVDSPATAADGAEQRDFSPPPGFRKVQRGKHTLYCKRDTEIGTRFLKESCFDELQLRDYLMRQQQMKTELDRIRSMCGGLC